MKKDIRFFIQPTFSMAHFLHFIVALYMLLENREKIADYLKKQGFNYVTFDLEGFKSGRMNDILTETEKKVFCEC